MQSAEDAVFGGAERAAQPAAAAASRARGADGVDLATPLVAADQHTAEARLDHPEEQGGA